MKHFQRRFLLSGFTLVVAFSVLVQILPMPVFAAGPAAVDLLSASSFVVLSKAGITNVPTSHITGNIGTTPITGASMTGLGCSEVIGTVYTSDDTGPSCRVMNPSLLNTAMLDMEAAYTDAAGRPTPDGENLFGGNLGGQTFAPGLYKWTTGVTISTSITLSGGSNDVWIFQIAGGLNVASGGSVPSGVHVLLAGGAQEANVFWQVGEGATLGAFSTFNGTILSSTLVALQDGAVLNGRALAKTEVTLISNTLSVPVASVPGSLVIELPTLGAVNGGYIVRQPDSGNVLISYLTTEALTMYAQTVDGDGATDTASLEEMAFPADTVTSISVNVSDFDSGVVVVTSYFRDTDGNTGTVVTPVEKTRTDLLDITGPSGGFVNAVTSNSVAVNVRNLTNESMLINGQVGELFADSMVEVTAGAEGVLRFHLPSLTDGVFEVLVNAVLSGERYYLQRLSLTKDTVISAPTDVQLNGNSPILVSHGTVVPLTAVVREPGVLHYHVFELGANVRLEGDVSVDATEFSGGATSFTVRADIDHTSLHDGSVFAHVTFTDLAGNVSDPVSVEVLKQTGTNTIPRRRRVSGDPGHEANQVTTLSGASAQGGGQAATSSTSLTPPLTFDEDSTLAPSSGDEMEVADQPEEIDEETVVEVSSADRLRDARRFQPFADVPESHEAYEAIRWLKLQGIVSGHSGGSFFPEEPIDRAGALVMVMRAAGYDAPQLFRGRPFSADLERGVWYTSWFQLAYDSKLIRGFEDGMAKPTLLMHRTDALVLAYKVLGIVPTSSRRLTFSDVEADAWFAPYYQDAVGRGVVAVERGARVRPFDRMTRAEFAQLLVGLVGE